MRDPFRRTQLAIAALFCCLGFQYATWAARLPAIATRLDLTSAEVGLLLLACGIGAAVSFPLVSLLMKKLGSRRLAYLSTLGLSVLLLTLSVAPNYPTGLVIMLGDGVAVACLNAAMNAQGAALEVGYQRNTMATLHATFSAGTLVGALLASGLQLVTPSLPVHFGFAAALMVLLVASTRSGLLRDDLPRQEKTRRGFAMPSRLTIWLGAAMAFGTVVEGAMNDWSALYLEDIAGAAPQLAPIGIAVVSVMMVLARLLADGWRARWGDKRVVLAGSALAGSGLAVGLLLGGVVPALIGFACVGLGMAAVTPCVYVAAAVDGPDTLTLVAAMGVTGLLAGPPMIGFIANATDLGWGMLAVAGSAILVSLCVTQIRWPIATPAERDEPLSDRKPPVPTDA